MFLSCLKKLTQLKAQHDYSDWFSTLSFSFKCLLMCRRQNLICVTLIDLFKTPGHCSIPLCLSGHVLIVSSIQCFWFCVGSSLHSADHLISFTCSSLSSLVCSMCVFSHSASSSSDPVSMFQHFIMFCFFVFLGVCVTSLLLNLSADPLID